MLFRSGGFIVARLMGFNLKRISDHDIEALLSSYSSVADARGFAMMIGGLFSMGWGLLSEKK